MQIFAKISGYFGNYSQQILKDRSLKEAKWERQDLKEKLEEGDYSYFEENEEMGGFSDFTVIITKGDEHGDALYEKHYAIPIEPNDLELNKKDYVLRTAETYRTKWYSGKFEVPDRIVLNWMEQSERYQHIKTIDDFFDDEDASSDFFAEYIDMEYNSIGGFISCLSLLDICESGFEDIYGPDSEDTDLDVILLDHNLEEIPDDD